MRWSRKVTFWDHEITKRKKGKTYTVRWTVDGERHRAPFHGKTAADAYKSELVVAFGNGEKFDVDSGLPQSKLTEQNPMTWYQLTLQYTEARWAEIGGRQRQSIAEGLSEATLALLTSTKQRPTDDELRAALRQWAFGERIQGDALPEQHKATIAWLEENTVKLSAFEDEQTGPALARGILERLSRKQNGKAASANYANRRRTTVHTIFKYAMELHLMRVNPLKTVSWKREQSDDTVDPAVVPNQEQIERLLTAAAEHSEIGPRLVAVFATMRFAGLRPEEAIAVERDNVDLPPEDEDDGKQFGEFRLHRADSHAPTRFNDDRSKRRSRRRLKHRSEKTVRPVPIEPRLVVYLREHIRKFGYGPGDRLFVGSRHGVLSPDRINKAWRQIRADALTAAELKRGLAPTPYSLRHACVSGWLAANIDPAQIAEWAGHSIETLLRVYAKCIDGNAKRAKRRLLQALAEEEAERKEQGESAGEGGGEAG